MNAGALHLFQAFGVEIEYMIVDAHTLDVRPITDRVLQAVAGEITSDFEDGPISWSNELASHVIELKTTEPAPLLTSLPDAFQNSVGRINQMLKPLGARLMPSAMHPWMDPLREMVLWPHDYSVVYEAFNRVFNCHGHGWANLQAVHLNLPFADDAEFARLHAAIRVLLPILPALSASSPMADGQLTGLMDTRLDVYRQNSRRIPRATGQVVPEAVFSAADYHREILQPLYAEIAPLDPEGTLQHEWLNSRGAIARFERNTIEVRVLDVQECPQADVAICALVTDVLESLAAEHWCDSKRLQAWDTDSLADLLLVSIRDADRTLIRNAEYLSLFGIEARGPIEAVEVWSRLAQSVGPSARTADPALRPARDIILERGPLARRITAALGPQPTRKRVAAVYRTLCESLAEGRMFLGLD